MTWALRRGAIAACALLVIGATSAAQAAPDPGRASLKELCKDGGFANVVGIADPEVTFRNQGQCIAFVNQGGQLRENGKPEE